MSTLPKLFQTTVIISLLASPNKCQTWYSANNKYLMVNTATSTFDSTFDSAHNYCMDHFGSSLASIHSEADNVEAYNLCEAHVDFGSNGCRIGLYQPDTTVPDGADTFHASWAYVDESAFDYFPSNWGVNEPQGGTLENCAALYCPYGGACYQWVDIPCDTARYYILCNYPLPTPSPTDPNCETDGEIKHINWEKVHKNNTASQIPFASLSLNWDETTLEMTFEIELEYIGNAAEDHFDEEYNVPTTYVIGFDSFGTVGNFINEPGNCENRNVDSFLNGTFTEWWGYSEYPYLPNELGTNTYLSYPPSTHWALSIADNTCSPIHYNAVFSWKELSECTNYNGDPLIEVVDDATSITLSGTLYVNVVSPFFVYTTSADSGVYRTLPLIQQDFSISILKQMNSLSSTSIQLFITSIIGIYEDEADKSFKLSVLTQSADYIELTNPVIISTPLGAARSIETVSSSYLSAPSYTNNQIFTITIDESQIECPPANFSGTYDMLFTVTCPDTQDNDVCNAFVDDNGGSIIALSVASSFVDNTCEPQLYSVIFDGALTYYDDAAFVTPHDESTSYVIGQDTIFVQVEVDFMDIGAVHFNIFDVVIENVFVCTADDGIDLTEGLDQQSGAGGCLSSSIDPDGPYDIILNGVENALYGAQIISYPDESNVVRFSFLAFDIGRSRMYVHAQLTLVLQNGDRRRLQANIADNTNQIRHFANSAQISNPLISATATANEGDNAATKGIWFSSSMIIVVTLFIVFLF